jgi:thiol-disulfide isomerase/thioredoxin
MKKVILSIAASALLLASCGKKAQPARPDQAQAPQTGAAYEKKDTYFKLPSAGGGEIDLASYAGKPVAVLFFTETCPYCRKAGPDIEKLYLKYSPLGLNFVGIDLDDNADAPKNFAKDLGITFPLAYNGIEVSRRYRTQGVPYIFLLDGTHKIYDVWEGYDESYLPQITKTIETLLSGK